MQLKSRQDFWAGALFLALGSGFAWDALARGIGVRAQPGPGWLPLVLGLALALLGALLLFKSLTVEVEGGAPVGLQPWRALVTVSAAMALSGPLFWAVGAAAGMVLLGLAVALGGAAVRPGRVFRAAAVGALGGALAALAGAAVFGWGLGRALPWWPAWAG